MAISRRLHNPNRPETAPGNFHRPIMALSVVMTPSLVQYIALGKARLSLRPKVGEINIKGALFPPQMIIIIQHNILDY